MLDLSPNAVYYAVMKEIIESVEKQLKAGHKLDTNSSAYLHNRIDYDKLMDLHYMYRSLTTNDRTGVWIMHPKTVREILREIRETHYVSVNELPLSYMLGSPVAMTEACPPTKVYLVDITKLKSMIDIPLVTGVVVGDYALGDY